MPPVGELACQAACRTSAPAASEAGWAACIRHRGARSPAVRKEFERSSARASKESNPGKTVHEPSYGIRIPGARSARRSAGRDRAPVHGAGAADGPGIDQHRSGDAEADRARAGGPGEASRTPAGPDPGGAGVVSQADLKAPMAHKLGCPLVDVDRFPIDLRATARLPLRTLMSLQALPLMGWGERIILAVPALSSEAELRTPSNAPAAPSHRRWRLAETLAA
jgi:hypothetical protein